MAAQQPGGLVLSELLRSAAQLGIEPLAGPAEDRLVSRVMTAPTLEDVSSPVTAGGRSPGGGHAAVGSLVVLPVGADHGRPDYALDLTVRRAGQQGVVALLLTGRRSLPRTVARVAERARVTVLGCGPEQELGELVLHLTELVRGGPSMVLARATAGLEALAEATSGDAALSLDAVLSAVGRAIGLPLVLADPAERGVPVLVDGRVLARIQGADPVGDDVARLVLPALTAAVAQRLAEQRRDRLARHAAREHSLSELLSGEASRLAHHADRARRHGARVDGFHTAVVIESDTSDAVVRDALFRELRLFISERAPRPGDAWQTARLEDALVLIRTLDARPPLVDEQPQATARRLLTVTNHPAPLHVGIGSAHPGPEGVRISTLEARSAVHRSRAQGGAGQPVAFDASAVSRLLEELASSMTARRVADELLAGLDALGGARAQTAIRTLEAWLDERGSLKAVGARLHLHPNAVAHRMRRVAEHLDVDLSDPEQRFALHLACRIRSRRDGGTAAVDP